MTIRRTLRELRRDKQIRPAKKGSVKPVTKAAKKTTRKPRAKT